MKKQQDERDFNWDSAMPWTGQTFKSKHNHGLSDSQADRAANQANAILEKTGNEGMAIAVANKHAKYKSPRGNK